MDVTSTSSSLRMKQINQKIEKLSKIYDRQEMRKMAYTLQDEINSCQQLYPHLSRELNDAKLLLTIMINMSIIDDIYESRRLRREEKKEKDGAKPKQHKELKKTK